MGLLGSSVIPLSIFLSEIRKMLPDLCVHECTSRFARDIFTEYLGDEYTILNFEPDLLSPHMFGWPCLRPRRGGQTRDDTSESETSRHFVHVKLSS